MTDVRTLMERANGLHEKIAADVPQISRGIVWCHTCGREDRVNVADCLKQGWPKCCGYTMSVDSPSGWKQNRYECPTCVGSGEIAPDAECPDCDGTGSCVPASPIAGGGDV